MKKEIYIDVDIEICKHKKEKNPALKEFSGEIKERSKIFSGEDF